MYTKKENVIKIKYVNVALLLTLYSVVHYIFVCLKKDRRGKKRKKEKKKKKRKKRGKRKRSEEIQISEAVNTLIIELLETEILKNIIIKENNIT
jgi:hypothetical protein